MSSPREENKSEMLIFQLIILTLYVALGLTVGRKALRKLNNKLFCRGIRHNPRTFF